LTGRSPTTNTAAGRARGFIAPRLRDARIRSKLGTILVIPLIAVIALAGVRLVDSSQRATAAGLVRSLTQISAVTAELAHELHRERIAAAELLAGLHEETRVFNAQATRTDQAVSSYFEVRAELTQAPELTEERLVQVDEQLGALGTIRQEILGDTGVTISAAVLRYGVIVSDLLAFQESVGQVTDDPDLAESVRAVTALSKAKSHMADAQASAFVALIDGSPDEEQVTSFLVTQTGQQEALFAFALAATPDQLATVNGTLTGAAVVFAERAAAALVRSAGQDATLTASEASRSLGAVVNLVRFAESRLHDDQVAFATRLHDEVRQQVVVESAGVVLALVVAVVIALLLARMLVRSLGRLRDGALTVANRDLPETVARFSDPQTLGDHTPAQIAAQVRDPIQLGTRDEIGEVAQAFNMVHQAAVRVAAEQAALRTSVSAMFLSLARRSQTLVDRMINQLDEIERNEEDPKRLSRLFALDHLATRMRRNDENLLVLAGADSGPPRSEDAPVPDILRAAQSEVEHYDRIEFGTVDSDVSVTAPAVNDVVRLVAELFDNATRFSPPDAPAVVEARRLGDQVIIQVEDRGVGMPQEQANQLNAWLAKPPAVEFTTFRRMGLAVVARLATRHGIRVELRSDPRSGTVVYVALPPSILILPQHRMRAADIPLPREPMPIERRPAPPVPARHLGQLPRRSAEVVTHSARRRSEPTATRGSWPDQRAEHSARLDQPVAGRPPEGLTRRINHASAATADLTQSDLTVELPIFREMEAVWFRSHGSLDLGHSAQTQSPPAASATTAPYRSTVAEAAAPAAGGTDAWQTAADDGWSAAAKAAEPPVAGATRSGLPKRVPQAQLVPGGVEGPTETPTAQRRSPDEVRGLLSAYHRGVQRGREHWGR
jgi:signal transduction histidine kinase